MAKRVKIGDIFRLPLGDEVVYGHVVAKCAPIFYMVVYDGRYAADEVVDASQIVKAPPILLGNFFDVLITRGDWAVVGNVAPNLNRIPFPCFKILIDGQYYVESWDGCTRRPASNDEVELLDRPNNNGPAFLQEAAMAHYGKIPFKHDYEKFTVEHVKARSGLL